ncbi:NAD(+) diphosphatase [Prevotella melaninogenica]|uniref:NAD(+) diphosphatase n=1 Tax=Prevotella TaxID=838 RepID=UPI0003AD0652|nr:MULTISPECIES: NAD(+) diphosphatase [Prevotella]ERJ75399.1 hydrolase, NUDIX family [Prevotella sp. F0091]QUB72899.1 NAD(+) diphosphatase [Prevotella melaninogenica]
MKKYWFVFCKTDIMLEKVGEHYSIPLSEEAPISLHLWTHVLNVTPMEDGTEVKAVMVDQPITDNPQYEMCGLRPSFYRLSKEFYLKAGKCHELLYWDNNTKFCGVCGAPMKMHTDISKRCTNCGKEIWPQLATAVIVLVHRADEVLLVHARNFKTDFYGLVAGFVETGETLEEAVHREVEEETGIKVKNLRYFGSQPWPYPCGLMAGFNADYDGGSLHLQRSEISKGAWFTKDNLPTIPEPLSIARMILDDWINKTSI